MQTTAASRILRKLFMFVPLYIRSYIRSPRFSFCESRNIILRILIIPIISVFQIGCASTHVAGYVVPGENLESDAIYIIRKQEKDERGLDLIIYNQLKDRGMEVYLEEDSPASRAEADIDVVYGAQWQWDITWYLLDLNVRFYRSSNKVLIASAQSSRTSLVRKDPVSVVNEALNQVLTHSNNK